MGINFRNSLVMSPAPTPRHQQISATLAKEFGNALENCKQCTVYDPIDYLVKEDTCLDNLIY